MEENRPKVGLGVIVIKEGKVLLQKRKSAHGSGTWSFSGGHLEFGESFEDCAKRETREEAGIEIKNIKFLTTTNDFHKKENKHYVTIFMTAEYDSGEVRIMEPDKCETWQLFSWDNLPKPLFLPIENLLKQGFNPFN